MRSQRVAVPRPNHLTKRRLPKKFNIDIDELIRNLDLTLEALWVSLEKQAFTAFGQKRQINLSLVDTLIHGGLLILESAKIPLKAKDLRLRDLKKSMLEDAAMAIALTEDTSARDAVMTRMRKVEGILQSRRA